MRSSGVFFVLFLVVAAVILNNTDVDCKATIEKIEEAAASAAADGEQAKGSSGGGPESWAEWAKDKLSFKSADDQVQDSSNANQDKADCVKDSVKDKACELAEETKKKAAEAYDKTGEVKDKACDMGKKVAEESKKRAAEAEDTLYWAEEKAKEGFEAAKSKEEEMYESGKEKLSHHQEL